MKVQELIKLLKQLPKDAYVVGVMSDEVEDNREFGSTIPDGCGYGVNAFWDSENKQVAIELG